MGSEYEKYGIAKGIATAVFLYSFSAGESKETTLPRIRVALLREGVPATIVGDAIDKLEEELWYFHSERKQYAFRNQPNLNRVIVDREETISDERIQEELKNLIQRNAGRAFEVYLWPESCSDIPDNKNLKLAILSPSLSHESETGERLVTEHFDKAGRGFRVYKNTLYTLLIDENQYISISKALRRFLALEEVQNDKSLLETLTKQSQEELKRKSREMEREIPFKIITAYRFLAALDSSGVKWNDLGIPTIGSSQTISERVKQYLKDQEKLLPVLTPKYVLDKAFGKGEKEKTLKEIYDLYLKTPGMSIPESELVLIETVRDGVAKGILGVRESTGVFYQQEVSPNLDSVVLRGEVARSLKKEQEELEGKGEEDYIPPEEGEEEKETKEKKKEGVINSIHFRAQIPWDKISAIISGVIRPLKDKGLPPEITIEIKANSEEGFDRTTLDSKVRETLTQIGAKIKEWKEE